MPELPPQPLLTRLGYLLKHTQIRLSEVVERVLAPFGISGRELAVLLVLATEDPLSQLEVAGRLRVDRTTMVGLIDDLEHKRLVVRRRSPDDRRRNIVELTAKGQDTLERAERARAEVEAEFLAPLGRSDADALVRALQALALAD
ncbi:MAG TPA: MarR family transcriptional regulator [Amycolatopsis sp.]|nr:MarR family transcriptional regulator [Amycolatopsis sp.]